MKLFYKAYFLLLVLNLLTLHLNSQSFSGIIAGKTVNELNEKPIENVSIGFIKSTFGTISNDSGNFIVHFPANYNKVDIDSIFFSCIGYQTKIVSVKDIVQKKDGLGNVKLIPAAIQLQDVIIRNLSLNEIIDSIIYHNRNLYISPAILNGYYREFVFTNDKCTEYADAIVDYYTERENFQINTQLKVKESRYMKSKRNKDDLSVRVNSKINPNEIIEYYTLANLKTNILPDSELYNYNFKIEHNKIDTNQIIISIFPKKDIHKKLYNLKFILSTTFILNSFLLNVDENTLQYANEKESLGIHVKQNKFELFASYQNIEDSLCLKYLKLKVSHAIWGKFLGIKINQTTYQISEFLVNNIQKENIYKFSKKEIYNRSNIYKNGNTIDALELNKYNIIIPTEKDSVIINSIK